MSTEDESRLRSFDDVDEGSVAVDGIRDRLELGCEKYRLSLRETKAWREINKSGDGERDIRESFENEREEEVCAQLNDDGLSVFENFLTIRTQTLSSGFGAPYCGTVFPF